MVVTECVDVTCMIILASVSTLGTLIHYRYLKQVHSWGVIARGGATINLLSCSL